MRINGHGHILPEPAQIPNFMKEKKLFWIDNDKMCVCIMDCVNDLMFGIRLNMFKLNPGSVRFMAE